MQKYELQHEFSKELGMIGWFQHIYQLAVLSLNKVPYWHGSSSQILKYPQNEKWQRNPSLNAYLLPPSLDPAGPARGSGSNEYQCQLALDVCRWYLGCCVAFLCYYVSLFTREQGFFCRMTGQVRWLSFSSVCLIWISLYKMLTDYTGCKT